MRRPKSVTQEGAITLLRIFFGTTGLASGPSRNLREFPCAVAHCLSDCIAHELVTDTSMGSHINHPIVEAHGGRLWAFDNFSRCASFSSAQSTSLEAHE